MNELAKLDEWSAIYQILDMEWRKRYQVGFGLVAIGWIQSEKCVSDLFDVNCSTETCFLTIVSLKSDAVFVVSDAVGGHRRMVRYLFGDEVSLAKFIIPVANEKFTQKRIERFLLRS